MEIMHVVELNSFDDPAFCADFVFVYTNEHESSEGKSYSIVPCFVECLSYSTCISMIIVAHLFSFVRKESANFFTIFTLHEIRYV